MRVCVWWGGCERVDEKKVKGKKKKFLGLGKATGRLVDEKNRKEKKRKKERVFGFGQSNVE